MEYRALTQGLDGVRTLHPVDEDVYEIIGPFIDLDWYQTIFRYNEDHYNRFKETHSLAGIRDTRTNLLVWDFDKIDDVEQARQDSVELCTRLLSYGIPEEAISIAFSGQKGFSIVVNTDKNYTVEEFGNINRALAKGLLTNDKTIIDPNRIFRVCATKHNKTDCYKYPLNLSQLSEMPLDEIRAFAANTDSLADVMKDYNPAIAKLPDSIDALKISPTKIKIVMNNDIASLPFNDKPRGFTNCKYALLCGHFEQGLRNNAMMAIVATCKALRYPKEVAYGMARAACHKQAEYTHSEVWDKEELWLNVVEHVYGPHWTGAQYSCKKEGWLKDYCETLGKNKCKHIKGADSFIQVEDMGKVFEDYSLNIDKNIIKTGIEALDDNIQLTIGMPVGLLGAPSSGKTSLALDILNNTSKSGLSSVFFSMDMYAPLIYMKQLQRLTGISGRELHKLWKEDRKKAAELTEKIKEEYKHVKFSTKAGHTVQDMREIISDYEQTSGDKVKLVLIDYLECIAGPYSDATANTSKIAGELRDFATETGTCVFTLLQPPKSAGDASQPLYSMRQVKGSSMLEQSFRVILGLYREGFGPKYSAWDRYITVNSLKNTMGSLFSVDNYWDGIRGKISKIDDIGISELNELREMRKKDASLAQTNQY